MAFRSSIVTAGLTAALLLGGCAGGGSLPKSSAADLPALSAARGKNLELFVADVAANVLIYTAKINQQNPPLLGEITQGVSRSMGVWVDRRGTFYVLNTGGSTNDIAEYKRGSSTPFKTIGNGLEYASSLAVDRSLNLYVDVTRSTGVVVEVYPKGASSPQRTVQVTTQGRFGAGEMAFDPKGDLLVDVFDSESNAGSVYSIAPGSSQATNLNLQSPPGLSLGCDKAGYIYVGDHEGSISIYPPGGQNPTRFINLNVEGFYTDMDVTANGTIYWPNYDNSEMFEVAPGGSRATNVFSTAGSGISVAVGPG